MFSKALNLACLLVVAFDVTTALNLRSEPVSPVEGEFIGYSLPKGLFKRQTSLCPVGSQLCAETSTKVYCAPVCCYVDKVFSYGCKIGYYCAGTGAGAGCCPVGQVCTGAPPDCVDYGKSAVASTTACPATAPICTSNAQGAPICSGTLGALPPTTSTQEVTTTIPSSRFAITTETTTAEEVSTTTVEVSTTTMEEISTSTEVPTTTEFTSTVFVVPTSNVSTTLLPAPPTSSSSRTSAMSLVSGLFGVGVTFFLL
ncbi:hypothetical protein AA313_de0209125 [Arthrobotrys entomopaga]|nr:hypothetical protein AA313_de0209125 [Arthrobotrys entomopaga]